MNNKLKKKDESVESFGDTCASILGIAAILGLAALGAYGFLCLIFYWFYFLYWLVGAPIAFCVTKWLDWFFHYKVELEWWRAGVLFVIPLCFPKLFRILIPAGIITAVVSFVFKI